MSIKGFSFYLFLSAIIAIVITCTKTYYLGVLEIDNAKTNIGAHAFDGCVSMYEANLGYNITEIGIYAFNRCKSLEKIELDEIKPSNRKYPYVDFKPDREPGREILQVKNISMEYLKNNDAPIEQIQIVETNNPETPQILDTSILENAGVNVKASLVQLKDIDTYNNKLIEFYEQLDGNILSLFEFKNSNSLDWYYACVSEMKKQAAQLGFTKFSEKLYEHELASKDDNSDFINNNFSKLKMESVSINNIIKKY
mgnify:CR=1 FL=1